MEIRYYKNEDYSDVVELYKNSSEFQFDEVTDSTEFIERKIIRDPESILIAHNNEEIVGSVSIIEDGRIAILFRLVAKGNNPEVARLLISKAENLLTERGFSEVHAMAPLNDKTAADIRTKSGFLIGETYSWFWKKISR